MSKNISTAFRPISLAYSSPAVGTTSTAPNFFYNAFPDLNDVAADGSRSAFPRRAKYILPLDSEFLPSAMLVHSNNIDENHLVSLDSRTREIVAAVINKLGKLSPPGALIRLPRKPELNEIHRFEALFEITHKRLAATDYKWAFRTYIFASLYTALEHHLVREQKIGVPLVPVANRRASALQRHWATVVDAFQPTLLLDEAASLLICLTLLPPEEWKAYEQQWVVQEEAEIPGFADFYRKLRDKFNPEFSTAETDRRALAEQILEYAKGALSSRTMENVSLAEEICLNLEEKYQRVFWPSLLGEEVHRGLLQLRVRDDLVLGNVAARIGIPEAMQWLMALFSVFDDGERSFSRKDDTWADYVMFSLEIGEDLAYSRITSADTAHLGMLVHLGIRKADDSKIDPNPNRAPADKLIADSICRYTIFLESIRQQICTGVGLRCPFWKGSGCCEFRSLLQRTYDVAKPWHPAWKHHWQRPPCLVMNHYS